MHLQDDELDFLETVSHRCGQCKHLMALHEGPACSHDDDMTCLVCGCTVEGVLSEDKAKKYEPVLKEKYRMVVAKEALDATEP